MRPSTSTSRRDPTATAIRIPANIEDAALRAAARARYGVVFSSGRGETLGKLVRIGHMGPTARPLYAVVALTALGGALRALGHPLDVAAGVAAALAVIDDGLAVADNSNDSNSREPLCRIGSKPSCWPS